MWYFIFNYVFLFINFLLTMTFVKKINIISNYYKMLHYFIYNTLYYMNKWTILSLNCIKFDIYILYDNFNEKVFLMKLLWENSCVKFDTFSRIMDYFYFLQKETVRIKSVNINHFMTTQQNDISKTSWMNQDVLTGRLSHVILLHGH